VRADFPVVLDACVLIPMPLADTLLRLAGGPRLFLPKWTDQIMAEVSRNLQENFGVTAEQAAYRESEIRRHFGEAWVEGYEDLIPSMTNHEKDRHVLAAAVRSGAETIVTYNLKDFAHSALAPYSITAQGPSTFFKNLYELDPDAVLHTLEQQAAAIGKSLAYLLDRLRVNVPGFVHAFTHRNEGSQAMEPYWSYEDIGAFFFVLVVLAALVRLGIRTHLLRSSDLVSHSLTLQSSIIIFFGIALYAILKLRHQKPVIAPLGWVVPSAFHALLAVVGGIAPALGITLFTYAQHHVMPMIPTIDFLVLGLLLGPILEESVFRGCLLPVVATTLETPFQS
jgi:hypothetical protein